MRNNGWFRHAHLQFANSGAGFPMNTPKRVIGLIGAHSDGARWVLENVLRCTPVTKRVLAGKSQCVKRNQARVNDQARHWRECQGATEQTKDVARTHPHRTDEVEA